MCPVCFANVVLVAIGATSGGGLTTFALAKFLKRRKQRENQRNRE
jgi:membrane protein YqaA with SNARE-associated domain